MQRKSYWLGRFARVKVVESKLGTNPPKAHPVRPDQSSAELLELDYEPVRRCPGAPRVRQARLAWPLSSFDRAFSPSRGGPRDSYLPISQSATALPIPSQRSPCLRPAGLPS